MAKDKEQNTGGVAVVVEYEEGWILPGIAKMKFRIGYMVADQPHVKVRQSGVTNPRADWYAYDSSKIDGPIVARARTLTALRVKLASPCDPLDDRQGVLL